MEEYDYFRFPETFDSVRAEEITEFLRETVHADRASIAIVEPRQGKER